MAIVSAKFVNPEETRVVATDDEGKEYFLNVDSDVPPWPDYIANGGVIEPYAPPVVDLSELDTETMNAALAQEGSIVRALGLVMFAEINKLRVKDGDAPYTMAQFKAALKAQMR